MKRNRPSSTSLKKGNIMMAVLIVSTTFVVILGAILSHSITERRINQRHELRLITKNAAETLLEYGFAQLHDILEKDEDPATDYLAVTSSGSLSMPTLTMLPTGTDDVNSVVWGGEIPVRPSTTTTISTSDPNNQYDPAKGQRVYLREIPVYAKATVADPRGGPDITTYVKQTLQVRDQPIFSKAIFYNLDLEIQPGPSMDILGAVASNENVYLGTGSSSTLRFHDSLTSAKNIRQDRGDGDLQFKNRDGVFVSMKDGETFNDSDIPNWRTYAIETWHGSVLTKEHDVQPLKMPAFAQYEPDDPATPSVYDPVNGGHDLIEPKLTGIHSGVALKIENQKMATKAGLYFKWDVHTGDIKCYNNGGVEFDVSALVGPDPEHLFKITADAFYDGRRGEYIDILDINMGRLKELIESTSLDLTIATNVIGVYDPLDVTARYDPPTHWNGVVYVETTTSSTVSTLQETLHYSGIRLWGAETDVTGEGIPSRGTNPGLSFATNNALYTWGNFNADGIIHDLNSPSNSARIPETNEVPVALYADSITILSEAWDDANSALPIDDASRKASHTEFSAAIVAGIVPSNARGTTIRSGGFENFPRFLEDWSSRRIYIRGAFVCLYECETDLSQWANTYYSAPNRTWGYNTLFEDGTYPPGTPVVRSYRRSNFKAIADSDHQAALDALPWSLSP